MTDERPIQYRGAFIGFPNPMPVITTDPTSASDWGLCLAEAWRPAVLGALKVLCRPETWAGSEADIQTSMLGAQKILQSLIEGCSSGGVPFACTFDVATSDTNWVIDTDGSLTPIYEGKWTSGVGFQAETCYQPGTMFTLRRLSVRLNISPPITMTQLAYDFSLAKGLVPPTGFTNYAAAHHGYGFQYLYTSDAATDPDVINGTKVLAVDPSSPVDQIAWQWTTAYQHATIGLGSAELYDCILYGLGAPPTGC